MSIGVLGMTRLQALSLQQHRSALLQSHASLMINDMLERISANPSVNYATLAMSDSPRPASNCIAQKCSPEEMKNFDITEWQCQINSTNLSGSQYAACAGLGLKGKMPGAPCAGAEDICSGGSITRADDIYAVSVQWVEQHGQGIRGNRQLTLKMKTGKQ